MIATQRISVTVKGTLSRVWNILCEYAKWVLQVTNVLGYVSWQLQALQSAFFSWKNPLT
jgi:hypothetical protein